MKALLFAAEAGGFAPKANLDPEGSQFVDRTSDPLVGPVVGRGRWALTFARSACSPCAARRYRLCTMKARFTDGKESDSRYLGCLNDDPDDWTRWTSLDFSTAVSREHLISALGRMKLIVRRRPKLSEEQKWNPM